MLREVKLSNQALEQLRASLVERLPEFSGKKVLIVGDVGLDEYANGDVRRISPEAPVPVLEVKNEERRLGLAAYVAQNIVSLGGTAHLVSVVGRDPVADSLKELMIQSQIETQGILSDSDRPTTRKLRVMSEHHHVVRVDYEKKQFLSAEIEKALLVKIEQQIQTCDCVILQDYAKGVVSENLSQKLINMAREAGKKVIVDPYRSTPVSYYRGASIVTPNRDESIQLSGISHDELRENPSLMLEVGQSLLNQFACERLVLTQGKEGMTLFEGDEAIHLPTYARQVFDVTGAGDTVIAALALASASGMSSKEACILANYAAGVVVAKVGCVPCEAQELVKYINEHPLS